MITKEKQPLMVIFYLHTLGYNILFRLLRNSYR